MQPMDAGDALRCAGVFARILASFDLHPNERRVGLWIMARSLCAGFGSIRVDAAELAGETGIREDRCGSALTSLNSLKLVFWNSGEGVATPNPAPEKLSRERALRLRLGAPAERELPLDGERLLDAALASAGRSAAVRDVSAAKQPECKGTSFDVHRHCEEFRQALRSGDGLDHFVEPGPGPTRGGGPPAAAAGYSLASASCTRASAKLAPADAAELVARHTGGCSDGQRAVWMRLAALAPEVVARTFQRACARADSGKVAAYASRIVRDDYPDLWRRASQKP